MSRIDGIADVLQRQPAKGAAQQVDSLMQQLVIDARVPPPRRESARTLLMIFVMGSVTFEQAVEGLPHQLSVAPEIRFEQGLDVLTRERQTHLGFGHGAHLCIGQHLAKMETEVLVKTLLTELPGLGLDPAAEPPSIVGEQTTSWRREVVSCPAESMAAGAHSTTSWRKRTLRRSRSSAGTLASHAPLRRAQKAPSSTSHL
jgi:hypothetical protein